MSLFSWKSSSVCHCELCGTETKGKRLCKECNTANDHFMFYCDGCGEDYPKTHLLYVNSWMGYFCDRCIDGSDL